MGSHTHARTHTHTRTCAPPPPTQRMEQERQSSRELKAHQAHLEDQIKDVVMRNQQYEGGVYGLPQVRAPNHYLINS